MWFVSSFMFIIFIILGVTTGLTPLFSRRATPFGVSVFGKYDFVEEKKKRFAVWNILISVLVGLPLFVFPFIVNQNSAEIWSAMYTIIGTFIYLIISTGLYWRYRKQIIEWKKENHKMEQQQKKIVIDMQYHEKIHAKSHWTFFVWQALIITIPVLIAFAFYDKIPEQIPINWDSHFQVNDTITKSVWGVLALPVLQVLMIPIFNYSNHAIVQSKQKLSPLDPKDASEKSRRFRQAWSNYTFAMTLATQLLMSFLFLFSLFSQGRFGWTLIVAVVVFLIFSVGGALYLTLKYGQAGEKLLDEVEQYYSDPDDEERWKFGLFYYNKEDPSVFVEKRFGIGSTLNLARWQAWLFIGGLLLFIVLTIIWSYQIS